MKLMKMMKMLKMMKMMKMLKMVKMVNIYTHKTMHRHSIKSCAYIYTSQAVDLALRMCVYELGERCASMCVCV